MKVLIIAQTYEQQLEATTWHAIQAAQVFAPTCTIALTTPSANMLIPQLEQCMAVEAVIVLPVEGRQLGAAGWVRAWQDVMQNYDVIVAANSTTTKSFLPRLAAVLEIQPITDVIKIIDRKTFVRPIYAGSAWQTVENLQTKTIISIRATAFTAMEFGTAAKKVAVTFLPAPVIEPSFFQDLTQLKSARPDLVDAKIVVSGGRGVGSKENFQLIEKLADKYGAAVGATRGAVDAGYAPNDWQVGQTGKVVAPELYIAIGLSGATQHVAGMKESKTIVAINIDPDAPIFQVADYGLVADLFTVIPEWLAH